MANPLRPLAALDTNRGAMDASPSKLPVKLDARPSAVAEGAGERRRSSLAPGRRRSTGHGARSAVAGAGRRQSVALGGSAQPRFTATGRTSIAPSGLRRASMAPGPSGGRMSLMPGTSRPSVSWAVSSSSKGAAGAPSVMRTRAQMEDNVLSFLAATNYAGATFHTSRSAGPTQAAFLKVFEHIYGWCYRSYEPQDKIREGDVLNIARDMCYPYAGELRRGHVDAAGSQQNWPFCLRLLDYMVQLARATADEPAGPRQDPSDNVETIYAQYLWECYELFLQQHDTFDVQDAALKARLDAALAQTREMMPKLREHAAKLEATNEALTRNPTPLTHERTNQHTLEGDIATFRGYRDKALMPRLRDAQRKLDEGRATLRELTRTSEELATQREQLEAEAHVRGVPAEQYERLKAELEMLDQQVPALRARHDQLLASTWSVELALSHLQNKIDEQLSQMAPLAERAKLVPWDTPRGQIDRLQLVANTDTLLPCGVTMHDALERIQSRHAEEQEYARRVERNLASLESERAEATAALSRVDADECAQRKKLADVRQEVADMQRRVAEEESQSDQACDKKERLVSDGLHKSKLQCKEAETELLEAQLEFVFVLSKRLTARFKATCAHRDDDRRRTAELVCALSERLALLNQDVMRGFESINEALDKLQKEVA